MDQTFNVDNALKQAFPGSSARPELDEAIRSHLDRAKHIRIVVLRFERSSLAIVAGLALWGGFLVLPTAQAFATALNWQRAMVGVVSVVMEQRVKNADGSYSVASRNIIEDGRGKVEFSGHQAQIVMNGFEYRIDPWTKLVSKVAMTGRPKATSPKDVATMAFIGVLVREGLAGEVKSENVVFEGRPTTRTTVTFKNEQLTLSITADPATGRPTTLEQIRVSNGIHTVETFSFTYKDKPQDQEFNVGALGRVVHEPEWAELVSNKIANMSVATFKGLVVRDISLTKSGDIGIMLQDQTPLTMTTGMWESKSPFVISDDLGRYYAITSGRPSSDPKLSAALKKATGFETVTADQFYPVDKPDETPKWVRISVLLDQAGRVQSDAYRYRLGSDGVWRPWIDRDRDLPPARGRTIATLYPSSHPSALEKPLYFDTFRSIWYDDSTKWRQRALTLEVRKKWDDAVAAYDRAIRELRVGHGYEQNLKTLQRDRSFAVRHVFRTGQR